MPKRNFSASQKGFTIMELLVIIFVVTLLSALVLSSYRSGQNISVVNQAVQRFNADLRRAQNLALSGRAQGGTIPTGYGIYTSSATQYILFYNTTGSKVYVPGPSAESEEMETINLTEVQLAPVSQNIYFTPPDPTTYINGVNSSLQAFAFSRGGVSKTVTVWASGRIDVD